jgi:hypothetical protein
MVTQEKKGMVLPVEQVNDEGGVGSVDNRSLLFCLLSCTSSADYTATADYDAWSTDQRRCTTTGSRVRISVSTRLYLDRIADLIDDVFVRSFVSID